MAKGVKNKEVRRREQEEREKYRAQRTHFKQVFDE